MIIIYTDKNIWPSQQKPNPHYQHIKLFKNNRGNKKRENNKGTIWGWDKKNICWFQTEGSKVRNYEYEKVVGITYQKMNHFNKQGISFCTWPTNYVELIYSKLMVKIKLKKLKWTFWYIRKINWELIIIMNYLK